MRAKFISLCVCGGGGIIIGLKDRNTDRNTQDFVSLSV